MGLYSDNFYSWLDRQFAAEKAAMDSSPSGYKHPDGKPCRAKSPENCPFYKLDKSEAENIDNLKSKTPSYDRKIKELKDLFDSGELKKIPSLANTTFDELKGAMDDFLEDLETYESEEHEVKWHDTQKRRDEIYEKNKDKEYATINAETGEIRNDCTGFGVTFHTTLSDKELSKEEYDRKVTELVDPGHADTWNVGIFQGGGEISIDCKDGKRALAMMLHWNQNCTYNYSSSKTVFNLTYDEKENPGLDRGKERVV
jgi:hypothetical protein